MADTLNLANLPLVNPRSVSELQGQLEALIDLAVCRAGVMLVENEPDDASAIADAARGGKRLMQLLHDLQDELK